MELPLLGKVREDAHAVDKIERIIAERKRRQVTVPGKMCE